MSEPATATATVDPSDATLMTRVRRGDRDAFERLVDRHRDGLVAYLARVSGDPVGAQDLAQEAFLRLYRAADRYVEQGHLQAYLYRIATNLLQSRRRGARRFPWVAFDPVRHEARDPVTPQDDTIRDETTRRVARAVAELPWAFRVPLVLHAVDGWPLARIAAMLDCRVGTVKSRISRARRNLRETLDVDLDLPGGSR